MPTTQASMIANSALPMNNPRDGWPSARITRTWRKSVPSLYWAGISLFMLSFMTLGLAFFDAREFQGVSVWLKPWKFQVSTGAYFLTLALFMAWLPKAALRTWAVRYVVWTALLSGVFEVAYITWQGAMAQASHFNLTTPWHATMYTWMGVMAAVLTSSSAVLAFVISRNADYGLSNPLKLAIVLGLIGTFVLGTGFGAYLGSQRVGHWVGGVLNDAGGLPLVKWSRSGGDLRVAHFFGIHAMHFIPAFAWAIGAFRTPLRWAAAGVWAFSLLFTAGTIWTFVQAVHGQPFWR